MPYLICVQGPNIGEEWIAGDTTVTIGRDRNNSVLLLDPKVSRLHCKIYKQANVYFIEDLGSSNGTFIRNRRIGAPILLDFNSIFQVGESVLLFSLPNLRDLAANYATEVAFGVEAGPGNPQVIAKMLKEARAKEGSTQTQHMS